MRSYTVLLAVLITAAQAQDEPLPPTGLPLLDDAVEQCSHTGALECYAVSYTHLTLPTILLV